MIRVRYEEDDLNTDNIGAETYTCGCGSVTREGRECEECGAQWEEGGEA